MTKIEKVINATIKIMALSYRTSGHSDRAGRYYTSEENICECCLSIRKPSRNFPYSQYRHEKSLRHAIKYYRKIYADDINRALVLCVEDAPLYINTTSPILLGVCRTLLGIK